MLPETADVVICGAGPVGLLTALGLAQQGIDTLVLEKRERNVQETFGRACTLYPRTLELLDQLDVVSDMTQAAFTGRNYAVYRDGKHQIRNTWQSVLSYMEDSFHSYITNIRQKKSESIFATRYQKDHNGAICYGWEIVNYEIDTSLSDGYNVTVTASNQASEKRKIRCKYLVGADGGRSMVRELAGIPMVGNETEYKWVRIDGRMKTNIPDPDVMFATLETKTHGNVLWLRLDNDAHRVGLSLGPKLQEKYPAGPTKEQAIEEAKQAVAPFELDIERLDWWTYYSIKQKVAETMHKDQFILLAGDAAHTHSSAMAQGMNTGVHDATNLIWKLAGTLKGWYGPEVLATFDQERRRAAQQLVDIDRQAARVISGDIPAEYKALGLNVEEAMGGIFQKNLSFTIGLGISYEPSVLNVEPLAATLVAGTRSPDALVYAPGPAVPIRLHDFTHKSNKGRWSVLVFAGHTHLTKSRVVALREVLASDHSPLARCNAFCRLATLMVGSTSSTWDAFDGPAIGKLYFDKDATAHSRYGVYPDNGAIVVVRPDGILGFAVALHEADKLEGYFDTICDLRKEH